MFLVGLMFLQAALAVPPLPSSKPPAAAGLGTPLWRDLRTGMTVENVAAIVGKVDGVKSVKVKLKKRIPDNISIDYVDTGILIGNQRFTIVLVFVDHALTSVALANEQCATSAAEQLSCSQHHLPKSIQASRR